MRDPETGALDAAGDPGAGGRRCWSERFGRPRRWRDWLAGTWRRDVLTGSGVIDSREGARRSRHGRAPLRTNVGRRRRASALRPASRRPAPTVGPRPEIGPWPLLRARSATSRERVTSLRRPSRISLSISRRAFSDSVSSSDCFASTGISTRAAISNASSASSPSSASLPTASSRRSTPPSPGRGRCRARGRRHRPARSPPAGTRALDPRGHPEALVALDEDVHAAVLELLQHLFDDRRAADRAGAAVGPQHDPKVTSSSRQCRIIALYRSSKMWSGICSVGNSTSGSSKIGIGERCPGTRG